MHSLSASGCCHLCAIAERRQPSFDHEESKPETLGSRLRMTGQRPGGVWVLGDGTGQLDEPSQGPLVLGALRLYEITSLSLGIVIKQDPVGPSSGQVSLCILCFSSFLKSCDSVI